MDSRNRPDSRTASIPSNHRCRGNRQEMSSPLVVRKLSGITPFNSMASSMNGLTSHNDVTFSTITSSKLRSDIEKRLFNADYDQRSLEVLVRLLKAGSFVSDMKNDENMRPDSTRPLTPAPSLEDINDATEPHCVITNNVTAYVIDKQVEDVKPSLGTRAMTSEAANFKKTIEELKDARERFGVCMSVNEMIARVRNAQQKNEKSRRHAGRLPTLNSSSSGESTDGDRTPRHCCVTEQKNSWLSLSGQKIKLRHQDHVERALGKSENDVTTPIIGSRTLRNIRSAPAKRSNQMTSTRKLAWVAGNFHGNRYVIKKVNRTLQNKRGLVDFSASYHGFGSDANDVEKSRLATSDVTVPSSQASMPNLPSSNDDVTTKQSGTFRVPSKRSLPTRPSSARMPPTIRSIVIKLPNSVTVTSTNNIPRDVTSSCMAPSPSHPPNSVTNLNRSATNLSALRRLTEIHQV